MSVYLAAPGVNALHPLRASGTPELEGGTPGPG
jgi:hypothetical protein